MSDLSEIAAGLATAAANANNTNPDLEQFAHAVRDHMESLNTQVATLTTQMAQVQERLEHMHERLEAMSGGGQAPSPGWGDHR